VKREEEGEEEEWETKNGKRRKVDFSEIFLVHIVRDRNCALWTALFSRKHEEI
jgi:hypothetical protein